jgi:hypothetical protein
MLLSAKLEEKKIVMTFGADTALMINCRCENHKINRLNEIHLPKSKINDFLEDMELAGIEVESVIKKSFLNWTHTYSFNTQEIEGTFLVLSKLKNLELRLYLIKIINPVYLRSLNFFGVEQKERMLKIFNQFKILAKKMNDSDFEREMIAECNSIKKSLI